MSRSLKIRNFPFFIGPMSQPINPPGIPTGLDFELKYEEHRGILTQATNKDVSLLLESAYRFGNELGNALSENDLARPYADDFLLAVIESIPKISPNMRALEIGAGTGYLTNKLTRLGFQAIGIEPGVGFTHHWARIEAKMVNDFFPSPQVEDQFDLVCAYMVLEHITNPLQFLMDIGSHLKTSGVAIIAVPDCTEELIAGDPSILIHEHVSYFDTNSLRAIAEIAGFDVEIKNSRYGRSLYAVLRHATENKQNNKTPSVNHLETYPMRVQEKIDFLSEKFTKFGEFGSVGVFCPARALYLLNLKVEYRFFEDDLNQIGKYIPPYPYPIEGRKELFDFPPEVLIIMSRTFGSRILESLRGEGYMGEIHLIKELYSQ
jgi:SAM-dependent methyltransferase